MRKPQNDISHAFNVLLQVLQVACGQCWTERLVIRKLATEKNEGQLRDHVFNLRKIIQKCQDGQLDFAIVDYTKVFDNACHSRVWSVLSHFVAQLAMASNCCTYGTHLLAYSTSSHRSPVQLDPFQCPVKVRSGRTPKFSVRCIPDFYQRWAGSPLTFNLFNYVSQFPHGNKLIRNSNFVT